MNYTIEKGIEHGIKKKTNTLAHKMKKNVKFE